MQTAWPVPRPPREIVIGLPYHIICRVNNGEYLFTDRISEIYISHIKKIKERIKFQLVSYSILPSHLHMIIIPQLTPINEIIHRLNSPFSKIVNRELGRNGHFWMGRYSSILIRTDRQYLTCMRYIDRNAYVAGLAAKPWEWKWAGTAHYALGTPDAVITDADCYLSLASVPDERRLEYQGLLQKDLPMDNLPKRLRKLLRLYFPNSHRIAL